MSIIEPQSQFQYPIAPSADLREHLLERRRGLYIIDYRGTSTPMQAERIKVIKVIGAATLLAFGSLYLGFMITAAAFTFVAGAGIVYLASIGPDLDDPEVRMQVVSDFFKKPPNLQQIAEKYTIDQVFGYNLLPLCINYVDYASIATLYQKNKTKHTNDVSEANAKANAEIGSIRAACDKQKEDLRVAPKNLDRTIARIDRNQAGSREAYILLSGAKHQIVEEIRQRTEVVLADGERDTRQHIATKERSIFEANKAYKNSLGFLEEQFAALLPRKAEMPLARVIRNAR